MTNVRRATENDLVRICRSAMWAFADDPLVRWLYPTDEQYFGGDGQVFLPAFRRWFAHDATFTTDDGVAVAAFIPPGRPPVEVPSDPTSHFSAELLAKFSALGPLLAENMPAEQHWYLQSLATHPHWQRQGIGAALIEPVAERCRAEALPLYLETESVENVAYYNHLGFSVRSEWDVPLDGPHMWGMIRLPGP